jgi:hypothetical protein
MASRTLCTLVALIITSCTRPNPRSCADGICDDPTFPFCDVDGALEGIPLTCIAVSCTPGEVAACRGQEAIRCNATGNDYELVECALGCDEGFGGCVGCATNQQCTNPNPVCDGGSCRACVIDDECDSLVCDADVGTCVPEARIVYAGPEGSNVTEICTKEEPCSLARAGSIAVGSANPVVLRLLPGTYRDTLVANRQMTSPLLVVARGATIEIVGGDAIVIRGGASLDIRDLTVVKVNTNGATAISCGATGDPISRVLLRDSMLSTPGSSSLSIGRCSATVTTTQVRTSLSPVTLNTDGQFVGDRLQLSAIGNADPVFNLFGTNVSVRVTNSIFRSTGVSFATSDATPPGSQLFFAYNTFVFTKPQSDGSEVNCFGSNAPRTARFENNIIFSTTTAEPFLGNRCDMVNNIIAPFAGSLPGNILANPRLVDAAGGDFKLQANSPAIDAAAPSQVQLDVDHDFEGTPRPQGPKSDIGAFERAP